MGAKRTKNPQDETEAQAAKWRHALEARINSRLDSIETSIGLLFDDHRKLSREHESRLDAIENEVSALSEDAGRAFVPFGDGDGGDEPLEVKGTKATKAGSVKDEPTDRTGD